MGYSIISRVQFHERFWSFRSRSIDFNGTFKIVFGAYLYILQLLVLQVLQSASDSENELNSLDNFFNC